MFHCTSLHFTILTTLHHHYTAPKPTLHHYFTLLHCNPNTSFCFTSLHPLHCTPTTPLQIAMQQIHCTPLLHRTVLTTLHHHYSTELYYTPTTLLHGAVLHNAFHQHCITLHFNAWWSAIHSTVFHCTSPALLFTVPCSAVLPTTLISLHFTARCSAIHFTVRARIRVGRVTDCGVRDLGSPGSILTSRTETKSLSWVVKYLWDACSVPYSG